MPSFEYARKHLGFISKGFSLTLLVFLVTAIALCINTATIGQAYAEGSKDLVANGGYRPYTERRSDTTADEPRLTEIGVYVQAGETVYFGSSVCNASLGITNAAMGTTLTDAELAFWNDHDIAVCNPDWDSAANPEAYPFIGGNQDMSVTYYNIDDPAAQGSIGLIFNYQEEINGPLYGPKTVGYPPLSFTATTSGIYHFKFFSVAKDTSLPVPAIVGDSENFQVGQRTATVAAWDVTVVDNTGDEKSGRVFTDELFLNMGNNFAGQDVLMSELYVLTDDGYEYRINFNGMDPFGFLFFSNARGLLQGRGDPLQYQSLYHSVKSNDNQLSDLAAHNIFVNAQPTEASDKTHRIFFNPPDEVSLQEYTGSPNLSTGDLSMSTTLYFTPAWDPDGTITGTVAGYGGMFSFENDSSIRGTSYQIILDFGPGPGGEPNKVVLSNALVQGENHVVWNGLDQYGAVVPPGHYDTVTLEVKGGEVHFPFLDVETNRNGIIVEMMNNIGLPDDRYFVYYNNLTNQRHYTGGWTEENWTVADRVCEIEGVNSSSGAMAYGDNEGDMVAVDLWTYYSAATEMSVEFDVYDGNRNFEVTKQWEYTSLPDPVTGYTTTDNSPGRPGNSTVVMLQMQWRIYGSGDEWADYDGRVTAYHDAVAMDSSAPYTFTGLERYAPPDPDRNHQYYEYRAEELTDVAGYETSITYGDLDPASGVATIELIENRFSPVLGLISVSKSWEADGEATGVRPERVRIEILYRESGSGDPWSSLINPDEGIIELADDNGWSGSRPVWLLLPVSDTGLEYCVKEVSYLPEGGADWVDLEGARENAPGYDGPLYSLDGLPAVSGQSDTIVFFDRTQAHVDIVNAYTTQLTVVKTWERGSDPSAEVSATVSLLQDGMETGMTASISTSNPSYTFTGLETGHDYSIIETAPINYTVAYGGIRGEDGYWSDGGMQVRGYVAMLTNTYVPGDQPVHPSGPSAVRKIIAGAGDGLDAPLIASTAIILIVAGSIAVWAGRKHAGKTKERCFK